MTLFKSECQNLQYMSMADDQKSTRSKLRGVKRPGSTWYGSEFELEHDFYEDNLYERVYDPQRVPSTVSLLPYSSNGKQLCSTSSSLSSRRCSRERLSSWSSRPRTSSRAKMKMEELQTIKRELTVIKMQIDGLLDSLERMDRQGQESTASPLSQNERLGGSLSHPSVSSPEVSPRSLSPCCRIHRDSPELGEASDEDTVHTLFSTISVNIWVTQSGRPKSIRNRLPRKAFRPQSPSQEGLPPPSIRLRLKSIFCLLAIAQSPGERAPESVSPCAPEFSEFTGRNDSKNRSDDRGKRRRFHVGRGHMFNEEQETV